MERLIFKSKKRKKVSDQEGVVRLRNDSYEIILELHEETGLSKTAIADKLIKYAYQFIEWEE